MDTTLEEILVVLGAFLLSVVESAVSSTEKIIALNFLELTIAEIPWALFLLFGGVMVVWGLIKWVWSFF